MNRFTVAKNNFLCIFEGGNRRELILDIRMVLPHLDGSDVMELAQNVLEKLENITDEEFVRSVLKENN